MCEPYTDEGIDGLRNQQCPNGQTFPVVEVGGIEPPCLDLGSEASPGAAGVLDLGGTARTGALGNSQPGWCSPRYPDASGE
jgi:hypothetical protein